MRSAQVPSGLDIFGRKGLMIPEAACVSVPLGLNRGVPDGSAKELEPQAPESMLALLTDPSDCDLLRRIGEGSHEALGQLFRKYARGVRTVAYRILRNHAEADDLTQDIFLFIFTKAGLFDSSRGTARSWIFQATYHRAFDRKRYLNTRHFYTLQDLECASPPRHEFNDGSSSEDLFIDAILGTRAADECDLRLPEEQRETIRLFFFEGYSLREIAQLTERPLASVRQYYYRGLARLRKVILPEKVVSKWMK